ncbi:MAG: hypothetical protein DCF26_09500 [Burkholderiales bacterium]|nr:MAG: hypothetical protein DCF26_09500 [Burkholderiales bacterium]
MNEKFLAQLIAELKHSQTEAMALLTQALCRQVDPAKLKKDLEGIIRAYEQRPQASPVAVQMAQGALAAAHAEQMIQANERAAAADPKKR